MVMFRGGYEHSVKGFTGRAAGHFQSDFQSYRKPMQLIEYTVKEFVCMQQHHVTQAAFDFLKPVKFKV